MSIQRRSDRVWPMTQGLEFGNSGIDEAKTLHWSANSSSASSLLSSSPSPQRSSKATSTMENSPLAEQVIISVRRTRFCFAEISPLSVSFRRALMQF